jgi:glycine cleavage system H protein
MLDPTTLHYSPTHEWVKLDGEIATVGVSQFAVDQLTDLIVIDLPKVGARVTAGKPFGEVESVKAVSDLYAPLDGEVVEINTAVAADVSLLAQEPYGKGWLIKIKIAPGASLAGLMDHAAYQVKIAEEGGH